tara:strand:+ start:4412 stop:4801 length:390 start_codon:yes stop_codon:yes gene_type:complete
VISWKELDLFKYLQGCCYPDLVKARKQLSRWDCYSVDQRHRIELKCRGKHYDTLLIEKKKYDAMIIKAKENLDLPMYINSTPKGVYRFNLFLIEPKWELQYHNKTTTFSNTNKIEKEVAMLPVIDAETL